jgi:hypothetical protein
MGPRQYLCIKIRRSRLERNLQCNKLKWETIRPGSKPPLHLLNILPLFPCRCSAVQTLDHDQQLISRDDAPDLLQIDNNCLLPAENCGGIDKERIEEAKVASWEVAAAHDSDLVEGDAAGGSSGGLDPDPGAEGGFLGEVSGALLGWRRCGEGPRRREQRGFVVVHGERERERERGILLSFVLYFGFV